MPTKRRSRPQNTSAGVESIDEYFSAIAGQNWKEPPFLDWPPNPFFLMASFLQRTGAYVRLVKEWPQSSKAAKKNKITSEDWTNEMRRQGEAWWRYANPKSEDKWYKLFFKVSGRPGGRIWPETTLDYKIRRNWRIVANYSNLKIADLVQKKTKATHRTFWIAVFEIVAAADEACSGIGISSESKFAVNDPNTPPIDFFLYMAGEKLREDAEKKLSATLCTCSSAFLGSVLPKTHTPQSGITLRSLTHHLAYIRPTEVSVAFRRTLSRAGFFSSDSNAAGHSINVLCVPWPEEVRPRELKPVECSKQSVPDNFGFFTYAPTRPNVRKRTKRLSALLSEAEGLVGRIDGVIMPELALDETELESIARTVQKRNRTAFLMAGVGTSSVDRKRCGSNRAVFSPNAISVSFEQAKHHRWQLDRNQIDQYGLGSTLDPNRTWWEHIPIEERRIDFVTVSGSITLTMLICEDLARQDPIGDVIRSVGPNLVVALLMDGPQLSGRWPAHYATVLADDPGSSVLTVTSIGMSHLSRPKGYASRRVIGLWRDRLQGFREIELPKDAEAVVLTLTLQDKTEWSADGRHDDGHSTYLTLNGIHPVFRKRESDV